MNYLLSDHNTWVWFYFILYALTIIFLVPNPIQSKTEVNSVENTEEKSLKFASNLILRTVLIFPMLFLLKNSI